MEYRGTKKALEAHDYFQETGGKVLIHAEIIGNNGWSVLEVAQWLGGTDVKKIVARIHSWSRSIIDIYLIIKFMLSGIFICCCSAAMPGNFMGRKIGRVFKYKSGNHTIAQLVKLKESERVNTCDMKIMKDRMVNLENGLTK